MEGKTKMSQSKSSLARLPIAAAVILGGFSLSACVTQEYVDRRIDEVNTHVTAVDARASEAAQKADAAMAAAQAAQAAAATANQRIDQLGGRVDIIEQRLVTKRPRG